MREKILQYCLKMVYINVKSMDGDKIGRHVDSKFQVLISCKNIHCLTEPSKQVKQHVGR